MRLSRLKTSQRLCQWLGRPFAPTSQSGRAAPGSTGLWIDCCVKTWARKAHLGGIRCRRVKRVHRLQQSRVLFRGRNKFELQGQFHASEHRTFSVRNLGKPVASGETTLLPPQPKCQGFQQGDVDENTQLTTVSVIAVSADCPQRSKGMHTLRDQACIVGVGETAYTRGAQKSVLRLVLEASRHAMADAGVTTYDSDGFVLSGPYLFQEELAAHLGINVLATRRISRRVVRAQSLPYKVLLWL